MKLLAKLLALPIRLANVPARTIENIVDKDTPKEDRLFSKPLDALADAIEEACDDD